MAEKQISEIGDNGAADEERDNENLELNEGSKDEGHNPEQVNGGGGGDETPITQERGRAPPGITPLQTPLNPRATPNPYITLLSPASQVVREGAPSPRVETPPYMQKTVALDDTLNLQLKPATVDTTTKKKIRRNWGGFETHNLNESKWEGAEIPNTSPWGPDGPPTIQNQAIESVQTPAGPNAAQQQTSVLTGGVMGGNTNESAPAGQNTSNYGFLPTGTMPQPLYYAGLPPGNYTMPNQPQPYPGVWQGYPYMPPQPIGAPYYPTNLFNTAFPTIPENLKLFGRHLKTRIWKGILYPDFITSLNAQLDALGPLNESQKITFAKSAISSDQNSEARKYVLRDNSFSKFTKLADFLTQLKTCLLYTSDAADERSSVDLGG